MACKSSRLEISYWMMEATREEETCRSTEKRCRGEALPVKESYSSSNTINLTCVWTAIDFNINLMT